MKAKDMIRLLKELPPDADVTFDAGGCASWHYKIDCLATVSVGYDDPEVMYLLAESGCDDDDDQEIGGVYASRQRLKSRRKFTDFDILSVIWIERSIDGDTNGSLLAITRSDIDQPSND